MACLKSIDKVSAANIFAAFCGAFGVIYMFLAVIVDPEKPIWAPLGLHVPYLSFKFDLWIGHSFHGLLALVVPFAFAASGWISGALCAAFYNLLVRFGLGFKFTTEP
jgi:hypothetical protein